MTSKSRQWHARNEQKMSKDKTFGDKPSIDELGKKTIKSGVTVEKFIREFRECDIDAQKNVIRELNLLAARSKPTGNVKKANKRSDPVAKRRINDVPRRTVAICVVIHRFNKITIVPGYEAPRGQGLLYRRYRNPFDALDALATFKNTRRTLEIHSENPE